MIEEGPEGHCQSTAVDGCQQKGVDFTVVFCGLWGCISRLCSVASPNLEIAILNKDRLGVKCYFLSQPEVWSLGSCLAPNLEIAILNKDRLGVKCYFLSQPEVWSLGSCLAV
ncbi:hypothetical protein WN943_004186 [Citrus x changshan-huyou]